MATEYLAADFIPFQTISLSTDGAVPSTWMFQN